MLRSGNPALKDDVFSAQRASRGDDAMTIQGTVNKTGISLFILMVTAMWAWTRHVQGYPMGGLMLLGGLGGFVVALVTIFKNDAAPYTVPLYAALEGLLLGAVSASYEARYPGIVMNAVALTFGTLLALLAVYKSRLIAVTENMRLGVAAATGGIALVYLISMVMGFFGVQMPLIHSTGPMGIAFSLFVTGLAAFNLVMDFDFIERGADSGAAKHMEWYGAFGLLVTLVWLYLEMLRLLAKLQSRRD
jgi:uncharacterized YccA/Bax inhibitor family protein